MSDMTFEKDLFIKSAQGFSDLLELEELLSNQVSQALAVVGDAAVQLVALCRETASEKGPVVTAKISETVVQIAGGGRNVLFAAAHGAASDHRLAKPRAEACGQILVFTHLSGEAQSNLIATIRVYKNGDCTDGEICWNIETGVEGIMPYLAHIVRATILESTVYWPAMDNMPSFLQNLAVLDEELHEESLKKPCVGFECNFKR